MGEGHRGQSLAARTLGGEPAPPRPRSDRRPPALRRPGTPAPRRHPAKLPPGGLPTPPPACEARAAPRAVTSRRSALPMAGPWRRTRGRGRRRERAGSRTCASSSVRPFPELAGAAALRARWGALTGDRSSPLHSSASLVCSARPLAPSPLLDRGLAHRDGGADGAALGPQAQPGWNPAAGTPRGRSNSGSTLLRQRLSSLGAGAGQAERGPQQAGPSGAGAPGGAERTAGPDGRGEQPDRQAAGAGLRDPLRRSRFPTNSPS